MAEDEALEKKRGRGMRVRALNCHRAESGLAAEASGGHTQSLSRQHNTVKKATDATYNMSVVCFIECISYIVGFDDFIMMC